MEMFAAHISCLIEILHVYVYVCVVGWGTIKDLNEFHSWKSNANFDSKRTVLVPSRMRLMMHLLLQ
jgi:hypothetical protein